ncbi:bifunctional 3-deoxy-7-phosphoheptulonate synthase/chorismate mutase [Gracilibacillus salinarum]|uniref:Bifunctional 3-deoxy-7-phosphoheptulonate synthase/chorismate mutase n=1 Tax=Gracilibacillus salinarum TaxID=2932255 RepID=A0ABY4GM55_9BACI|nr:bifunctional 3-deoxy-7-phosphoheptulonate synthase/chorismate mutase [Gracilibacillus salinarum]UOQ84827.1 bifunctional 3-deoxy-7-phosphoheptulonate synthase/chorismate mutase [Gracilibacillus salinarum]
MTVTLPMQKLEEEIIQLISERGKLILENQEDAKLTMDQIEKVNNGPYDAASIQQLFTQLDERFSSKKDTYLYSRDYKREDTVIQVKKHKIGQGEPVKIMGPCSVETEEQVRQAAADLASRGVKFIRGGAFKPRTSPYDFQGLGINGLRMLSDAARIHDMAVVSEIMSADQIETALPYIDIIQVGSRNMQNFELLKAVGRVNKPVLLKRGLSSTIKEFKMAAEYILAEGNPNVILCERGIRTYEDATRNTLDISAVPILKQETHLPVLVDITHSTGRKDILLPTAKAALAVGADGIMTEVHPNPAVALSDAKQQMDLSEFHAFMDAIEKFEQHHLL